MGAPTEYYVDVSVASDGGSGTLASPWTRADANAIQYALDNITRDATNGDRINVRGVAHTSVSPYTLVTTTYGTPNNSAPLWIQGYDTAAGDGGRPTISGSGYLFSTTSNYVHVADLILDGIAININIYGSVIRNKIMNVNTGAAILASTNTPIINNEVYIEGSAIGISLIGSTQCLFNYVEIADSATGLAAIRLNGNGSVAGCNIIKSGNGSNDGILLDSHGTYAVGNSIYSNGGTGKGIHCNGVDYVMFIQRNLVEGFSGTGGIGILTVSNTNSASVLSNSVYNCTTAFSLSADDWLLLANMGNETLGASPFTSPSTNDFTPVDTGSVLSSELGIVKGNNVLNYRGAVQPASGGGGGSASPFGYGFG